MKKEYNKPVIIEEKVELEDVIAASNGSSTTAGISKSIGQLFGL